LLSSNPLSIDSLFRGPSPWLLSVSSGHEINSLGPKAILDRLGQKGGGQDEHRSSVDLILLLHDESLLLPELIR
jgi:hypothetical protein